MKLHVSNLSRTTTDQELNRLFAAHGTVLSACVLNHLKSRSALIEMESCDDGHAAIAALNGKEYQARQLLVAWATPRQERSQDQHLMFESMNIPDAAETTQ